MSELEQLREHMDKVIVVEPDGSEITLTVKIQRMFAATRAEADKRFEAAYATAKSSCHNVRQVKQAWYGQEGER